MIEKYLAIKSQASRAPRVDVSRAEYIRLAMESGRTEEQAELDARLTIGIGSRTLIGGQLVGIKEQDAIDALLQGGGG